MDEAWLLQRYEVEKLTTTEIATLCGRSARVVCWWLAKYKIKTRGTKAPTALYKDPVWLAHQYVELKLSGEEIAQLCGTSKSVVYAHLKQFQIPKRSGRTRIVGGKKQCDDCTELLPLSQFHKRQDGDGYWNFCRVCYKARYDTHQAEYRKRPEIAAKLAATSKAWGPANQDRRRVASKRSKDKRKHRIDYRLNNAMSTYIHAILRGQKAGRKWAALVGYTADELRARLEDQFEPWMTWDNWGVINDKRRTWNIDHIRPVSSFNITSAECEDFKQCWALTNLMPLDAFENVSKGNKWDE